MQLQNIKSIIKKYIKTEKLYNLAVETDESYIANNIVVHNCRSIRVEILQDEVYKPGFKPAPDLKIDDLKISKDYILNSKKLGLDNIISKIVDELIEKDIINTILSVEDKEVFDKLYNKEMSIDDKWLIDKIKEAKSLGISEDERKAISLYTGNSMSFYVNKNLRDGTNINELNIFSKLLSGGLSKAKDYNGYAYRGISLDGSIKDPEAFIKILKDNNKYNTEGYLSTTTDINHSIDFMKGYTNNIIFKIKSNNGKDLKNLATSDESEILFNKGVNFNINNIKEADVNDMDNLYGKDNKNMQSIRKQIELGKIKTWIIEMEDTDIGQFKETNIKHYIDLLESMYEKQLKLNTTIKK